MRHFFKEYPLHTLLFSIYPVISLYMVNRVFIEPNSIVRSLIVSAGFAVLFTVIVSLIVKDWSRAGLIASYVLFLFFTYGHVYNLLIQRGFPIRSRLLGWIWLLLFVFVSFFILRIKRGSGVTFFLNIASMILLILPLWTIGFYRINTSTVSLTKEREKLADIRGQEKAESGKSIISQPPPDIYYILLDGYERADYLQSNYGFDNTSFIAALEKKGFYIGDQSRSNYMNTTFSMNTSLNLEYFHKFPRVLIQDARYNLQTNHVTEFLHDLGYQIVVFDSGTGDSNNQPADTFLTSQESTGIERPSINAFESLLIRTTLLSIVINYEQERQVPDHQQSILMQSVNRELDVRRSRIQFTFDHLSDFAADDSPQFIFAHIYSPHIPFLFTQNGYALSYDNNVTLYWYEISPEEYVPLYGYQIEFLNKRLITAIDQILQKSSIPPIIILQSDHGDDHYLDWKSPDALGVAVRTAILYAVYYPDQNYKDFYPTITPVNTFRLVFNHWFNTSYPLLPDQVYYHQHPLQVPPNQIPEFPNACQAFRICLPDYSQ